VYDDGLKVKVVLEALRESMPLNELYTEDPTRSTRREHQALECRYPKEVYL